MQMNVKFLLAATLMAGIGLASCTNENDLNPDNNKIKKGEPTYTAFSLKMGGNGSTRATGDDIEGTSEENSFGSDVNIYIFSNGMLEVAASPEINGSTTVPVAVTTGEKTIYAVSSRLFDGENQITFYDERQAASEGASITTLADFEKTLFNALDEKIAVPNAFTMIGSSRAVIMKDTEAQALANPVKIDVDRAAVKVGMKYDPTTVSVYPTLNATFSAPAYDLAHQARQMYVSLANRFTPTGSKIANNGTYPGMLPVAQSPLFLTINDDYSTEVADNKYAAECVVENPTTGNMTFALVRLTCKPKGKPWVKGNTSKSFPADGTFWTVARNDAATATWIYASDDNYNIIYFATESDAKTFITDNNLGSNYKAYKYDKGYCYYKIYLQHNTDEGASLSDKYRLVRNNYYRVNITDIKALGSPTGPGVVPTDPDTPIEQDSWLAAEISVKPWILHEQDSSLQ